MKTSAVQWLDRWFRDNPEATHQECNKALEQAIEMEKQQMFGFTNHHHVIGEGTERFFKEEFELYYNETYGSKGSDETLKENHIVDINEMVKRGTLKKRMDKDSWFVVFQSNAYNESDMAYELLKSQEIDIDMYDVYKDGDEVTFEVVNKKWAKITPFLYPFKTTSSQTEISDEEIKRKIEREIKKRYETTQNDAGFRDGWFLAIKWYREQLKQRQ